MWDYMCIRWLISWSENALNLTAVWFSGSGKKFISPPKCTNQLWSRRSLIFRGHHEVSFTRGKAAWAWNWLTRLHLESRLKISGSTTLALPHVFAAYKGQVFRLTLSWKYTVLREYGFCKEYCLQAFKLKRPVQRKTATVKILVRMTDAFPGGYSSVLYTVN